MKIVGALAVCLFLSFIALAQQAEEKVSAETAVGEITLFKSDGAGGVGDETEIFHTSDIPVYCSIRLGLKESVNIKMILVAVKAAGLKAESKIVTVNYKTNSEDEQVTFNASPASKIWAPGRYRVDIFIDGKLSAQKEFEIVKAEAK